MEIEQLAAEFKSKLHSKFPNMQEVELKIDGVFLTLKLIGFVVSIEKDEPSALEMLFQKAIEIVETAYSHIKNRFDLEETKKYEEFRASCINQEKNAAQAALVSSKAGFYAHSNKDCKRSKESPKSINIQRKRNDGMQLLDALERKMPDCDNSLILWSESANGSLILNSNTTKDFESKINGEADRKALASNNISNETSTSGNTCGSSLIYDTRTGNLSVNTLSNSNILRRDDCAIYDCNIFQINDAMAAPPIYNSEVEYIVNGMGAKSPALSNFVEKACEVIRSGLINVKNLDVPLKNAKRRRLSRKKNGKNVVFDDAEFSLLSTGGRDCHIDFNISDILVSESSFLNSSSDMVVTQTATTNNNTFLDSGDGFAKGSSDRPYEGYDLDEWADCINAHDAQISVCMQQNDDLKALSVKSRDSRMNSKGSLYNVLEEHLLSVSTPTSNNLLGQHGDPRIPLKELAKEPHGDQRSEVNIDSNIYKKITDSPDEYHASLSTSALYDNSEYNGKENQELFSTHTKSPDKMECPDTSAFKQIILSCKGTCYSYTEIIRRFCLHYQVYFPEFETVRENDVFICTATFLGINFVSSYEYDKQDAKNDACKKILEYVSRNWECIFNTRRWLFRKL